MKNTIFCQKAARSGLGKQRKGSNNDLWLKILGPAHSKPPKGLARGKQSLKSTGGPKSSRQKSPDQGSEKSISRKKEKRCRNKKVQGRTVAKENGEGWGRSTGKKGMNSDG